MHTKIAMLLKKNLSKLLILFQVDHLFRRINRHKLLVIMYHGVTTHHYSPPVWTQLPESVFEKQIKFFKEYYHPLSISEVISILESGREFPDNSVLVTFDDGLKNNYSVASPILKKHAVPAVIYLTVDFIGTEKYLWFDELFFLVSKASDLQIDIDSHDKNVNGLFTKDVLETYRNLADYMKRIPENVKNSIMDELRGTIPVRMADYSHDFSLLNWDEVLAMKDEGIIDFGVHTANHRIVSGLHENEWDGEIRQPGIKLSRILRQKVLSFCYPNGRPDMDFHKEHEAYLMKSGYRCAFSTESTLNDQNLEPYRIGRLPAGNDFTSDLNYFRLNTAGAIRKFKKIADIFGMNR